MTTGMSSFALGGGSTQKQRVSYFYDDDVGNYTYGLGHPMKPHRVRMCHSLVTNYGLYKKMDVIRPKRATARQMTRFHNDEYVDFLYRLTPEMVGGEGMSESTKHLFNLGDDCPVFDGLFEFCSISAGGSIAAANKLTRGEADIAINWAGGLHHAKKTEASGFCYINDIVLAVLELLRYHQRVLYIDIDIHHGDGVEEAFYTTDRVMTASFHMTEFFPGTGKLEETGIGKGKNYAVNVPLQKGMDDWSYQNLFEPIIKHIMEWYRPGAVILQCGADSLAGDKLGCFNLSMKGHANCVAYVKSFGIPMIVVGGGGYTVRNVARAWTFETAVLLNQQLPEELPFNSYFEYYGPEYRLDVPANNMKNDNTPEDLLNLRAQIIENLRHIPCAPSVQMQEVPRDYTSSDDEDDDVDFDTRISRRLADSRIVPDEELSDSDDDDGRRNIHDANGAALTRSSPAASSSLGVSGSGRLSGRVTTMSAAHNFSSQVTVSNGAGAGVASSHSRKFVPGATSDAIPGHPSGSQGEWGPQASSKPTKGGQGAGGASAGTGSSAAGRRGRGVSSSSLKQNGKDSQQAVSLQQQGSYGQSSKGREIHSKEYQPRESHHREIGHHGPQSSHSQQSSHSSQQPPHGQSMPPHPSQGGPSHHHHSRDQQQMQMQQQHQREQMHREHQHRDMQMMREQEQREHEQREHQHHQHQIQIHQQRRTGGSSGSSRSEFHAQYSVDDMMRYGPQGSGGAHGGYSQHPSSMHYGQGPPPPQSSQLPPPTQSHPHGHLHSGSMSHGGPHSHSHSHSLHHHSQVPHGSHPQHVQHAGPPPPSHHHMQPHHPSIPPHSHHHGPPPPSSQQPSGHHYSGSTVSGSSSRGAGPGMSQGRPGSSSGPMPGMHGPGYGGPSGSYGGYLGDRHEEGHKDRKDHYKDSSSMDLDDPRMMDARAPPPPPPSHAGPGMPPMGHHSHPSHSGSVDFGRMMPGGPAAPPHYGHRRGGSHGGSQGDLRGAMMPGEPPGPGPYGNWDRERMERERDRHHGSYRGPNAP